MNIINGDEYRECYDNSQKDVMMTKYMNDEVGY